MAQRSPPTIAGGSYRGTRLAVADGVTRPMRTRLREALFSAIHDRLAGATVLDLYAGAGSLGLEALSRGAASCLFVERDRRAQAAIRKNLAACGLDDENGPARLLPASVDHFEPTTADPFTLVFADPPFVRADALPESLERPGVVDPGALLVFQIPAERVGPERLAGWALVDRRLYGASTICLYERGSRTSKDHMQRV